MNDQNGSVQGNPNALALPVEQSIVGLSSAVKAAGLGAESLWTTLRADTESEIAAYSAALSGEGSAVMDLGDAEIVVQHVLIHQVMVNSQAAGGLVATPRLVLISPQGDIYHTVGVVAVKSFVQLMQFAGMPPYQPGVVLKVQRIKTRQGQAATFRYLGKAGMMLSGGKAGPKHK